MKPAIFGKRNTSGAPPAAFVRIAAGIERTDDTIGTMRRLASLGEEIMTLVVAAYTTRLGVHGETAIAALAAVTGEFITRATGKPQEADPLGRDDIAEGLLYADERHGMWTVWSIVYGNALAAGARPKSVPNMSDVLLRTQSTIGTDGFPESTVPENHQPQEWPPHACARFRDAILDIELREVLTAHETVLALAFGVGFLVSRTIRTGLDPAVALLLAAEILAAALRMPPISHPELSRLTG